MRGVDEHELPADPDLDDLCNDVAVADNDDMNARIRRRGRPLPRREEHEPEPEPSPDLGAGPRRSVEGSGPDAFRKWLWQQTHRSKLESVTVNADLDAMRRRKP